MDVNKYAQIWTKATQRLMHADAFTSTHKHTHTQYTDLHLLCLNFYCFSFPIEKPCVICLPVEKFFAKTNTNGSPFCNLLKPGLWPLDVFSSYC